MMSMVNFLRMLIERLSKLLNLILAEVKPIFEASNMSLTWTLNQD
jgi:hypothetical protein